METDEKLRISFEVFDITVTETEGEMKLRLKALDVKDKADSVELTGMLFSMMYAAKKVYDDAERPSKLINTQQAEVLLLRKFKEFLSKVEVTEKDVAKESHSAPRPIVHRGKSTTKKRRKWSQEALDRNRKKREERKVDQAKEALKSKFSPEKKHAVA